MIAPEGETIVAAATAPGRAALAIVRVSGRDALRLGRSLVDPFPSVPRQATLARISDREGRRLDEAVVIVFEGPASFTGEDVVEITCHGGAVVATTIVAAFVAEGARPAAPGEFTRRAVLNGKLDIVQAEAIGDLIDARSRAAQSAALAQLDGNLSRRIEALRHGLLDLEALCAYDIDFPEEDDGPIPAARILDATARLADDLEALLATAPMGEMVRDGAIVVIAGAPNVGKSSLFNALLGQRRAIVTEVPGTTRDAIEAVTEAHGWPVRLVDTAGLRESDDLVERLGIEISLDYIDRAHLVLACGDSEATVRQAEIAARGATNATILPVRTKADAGGEHVPGAIAISAYDGTGLADLTRAIADALSAASGEMPLDAPMITRERHRHGITRALEEVRQFRTAWETSAVPPVVAAVHLRAATRELEEIVGAIDVEDVLDRLFSTFCVGK